MFDVDVRQPRPCGTWGSRSHCWGTHVSSGFFWRDAFPATSDEDDICVRARCSTRARFLTSTMAFLFGVSLQVFYFLFLFLFFLFLFPPFSPAPPPSRCNPICSCCDRLSASLRAGLEPQQLAFSIAPSPFSDSSNFDHHLRLGPAVICGHLFLVIFTGGETIFCIRCAILAVVCFWFLFANLGEIRQWQLSDIFFVCSGSTTP
jgi:hypothetical protein